MTDKEKNDSALWALYLWAREINPDLPTGDDLADKVITITLSKDCIRAEAH